MIWKKNDCIFWFTLLIFIYFCCWMLFNKCYFEIMIFWFCVWFSSYVCLLSWSSHHDLHIFVFFSFCELLHLLLMFIKSRNSWLLIWQVTLCLLWVVLWTLLDSLYIALLLLKWWDEWVCEDIVLLLQFSSCSCSFITVFAVEIVWQF